MNDQPATAVFEQFRFPGTMQYQMTVADQKAAGLIANDSRSIHPKNWGKASVKTQNGR